jgi:hypothetical protein
VTEAEARAALRAFVGVADVEPWIAAPGRRAALEGGARWLDGAGRVAGLALPAGNHARRAARGRVHARRGRASGVVCAGAAVMDTRARVIFILTCASVATIFAAVWWEWAGIKAALRRQFPGMPKSRRHAHAYVRSITFAFGGVAFWLFLELGPSKRTLGLEALWFQFGGAALLWWESNSRETFNVVVEELRTAGPKPPRTLAERIVDSMLAGITGIIWVLAFLAVGSAVWINAAPRGWHYVVVSELKVAGVLFVFLALSYGSGRFIYGSGRFIDWRAAKVARAINGAETPAEAEWHARRAVRTVGFALVTIGTALQVYPAWKADFP